MKFSATSPAASRLFAYASQAGALSGHPRPSSRQARASLRLTPPPCSPPPPPSGGYRAIFRNGEGRVGQWSASVSIIVVA